MVTPDSQVFQVILVYPVSLVTLVSQVILADPDSLVTQVFQVIVDIPVFQDIVDSLVYLVILV